jgi:hypothetical protein
MSQYAKGQSKVPTGVDSRTLNQQRATAFTAGANSNTLTTEGQGLNVSFAMPQGRVKSMAKAIDSKAKSAVSVSSIYRFLPTLHVGKIRYRYTFFKIK